MLEDVTNMPPAWALEMAEVSAEDEGFPFVLDGVDLALNRLRSAVSLDDFAEDKDVWDFPTLDVMAAAADTVASFFLGKAPVGRVSAREPESGAPGTSRMKIKSPLHRIFQCASSGTALLHHAGAAVRQAEARCSVPEQACAGRLAAMYERGRLIVRLYTERNARQG
jgi:hypothetical protein